MNDTQRNEIPGQLNPGEVDQSGNPVNIKKNERISDQGNEWSDKDDLPQSEGMPGVKAEKYLKETADFEDLPDEDYKQEANKGINEDTQNAFKANDEENRNDVIEDPEDYVPGYDLGRNKVQ